MSAQSLPAFMGLRRALVGIAISRNGGTAQVFGAASASQIQH